jgi:SAM-dependent methyltransferase
LDTSHEHIAPLGERILGSETGSNMVKEHRARYELALRYIRSSDRVLDCACGTGYGSEILAGKAAHVTGVDLSAVAVAYAQATYGRANIIFKEGSAYELPVESGSLDVFCSFETIEHVEEPHRIVSEAKRVLKDGGKFLVSTPNRILTGVRPGEKPPHNPFHMFEWSLAEFDACLRQSFDKIEYLGQRIYSRNKLAPAYLASKVRRVFGRQDFIALPKEPDFPLKLESKSHWQPRNFIAVCTKS